MDRITELGGASWPYLSLAITLAIVAIGHFALFSLMCSIGHGRRSWRAPLSYLRWPTFWLALGLVAGAMVRSLAFPQAVHHAWITIGGLLLPAVFGWLAIGAIRATRCVFEQRTDIRIPNNLAARRRRTRADILSRIAIFLILVLTLAMMLLSIPSIRSVGFTLMASAGLVAILVGAAAQPAMKNLIAGIQMAFTEPIRIDDVVIIDDEWGRIEQIGLTYVVVALWDQRRLIVPISKLLEESFQNWTRRTSELLGTVFLYLDPRADIEKVRRKFLQILPENPDWDGRVGTVQVTDAKPESIEVRLLVSASDAGKTFDLRCDIREAMIRFVQREMPDALPHRRDLVSGEIQATREAA